jgi:predicted phosphodiesterase
MKSRSSLSIVLACVAFLFGCGQPSEQAQLFQYPVDGSAFPWTHDDFDARDDRFTFAIFSDLTGGERDRVFEIAVSQLNLLRPELIMNVGDLIEGDANEEREGTIAEWSLFDERADRAIAPIFYAGGNHDLSSELQKTIWDERYGRRYYHFVYKNVLFLILDTEDNAPARMREIFEAREKAIAIVREQGREAIPTTEYYNMPEQKAGNIGAEQSQYFKEILASNSGVRWTFLFMHKAPWEREDAEGFFAIESALADRPYTVFHGHVHTYKYEERNNRDYIRLATTGGAQFPELGRSADQIALVTVDDDGVDIANLLMAGILDKTGHIPHGGDEICFEAALCDQ